MTRGSVDVVNPLDLNAQFSHLLEQAILGSKTRDKREFGRDFFYLNADLCFVKERESL